MKLADFGALVDARSDLAGLRRPERSVIEALHRWVELLRRWNVRINLTALPLEPLSTETIDRLIIEPIAIASRLSLDTARWFDLGSGGGSPAIPIKLCHPRFELTMVEAKSKKASFLREAIRDLGLQSAHVENARFETLQSRPDLGNCIDLVTVRAVKVDDALLDTCRYVLRPRGRLVLLGSPGDELDGFSRDATGFFEKCST